LHFWALAALRVRRHLRAVPVDPRRTHIMRRCFALTRNLNRCGRTGGWSFFCHEHRRQPLIWSSFVLFTVLAGIASIQSAWWHGASREDARGAAFDLDMSIRYPGDFRLRLVNRTARPSGAGYIEVVSWADGAPAEDLKVRELFPNLIPNADWSYDVDLFRARREHSGSDQSFPRNPLSGYVAVSCDRCAQPQGWAFHVPGEADGWPSRSGQLSLTEFRYPSAKPGVGSSVKAGSVKP
jgi:hypothetical protein